MQINQEFWEKARKHQAAGNITIREKHGLFILNYTEECMYSKAWDGFLEYCRGLIVSPDKIVARGFKKFFNLGETEATFARNLPQEVPEVANKLDGSMGVLYQWNGVRRISTRGGFDGEQANRGTEIFNRNFADRDCWDPEYSYLFEIIYPENKIIVEYGDLEDLILIGIVHTESGRELSYREVTEFAFKNNLPVVRTYNYTMDDVLQQQKELKCRESEGFVLFYSNGLRLKVKALEYTNLASMLNGVTPRTVLKSIVIDKNFDDVYAALHEEARKDVDGIVEYFRGVIQKLENEIRSYVDQVKDLPDRKAQAEKLKEIAPKEISGYVFLVLNNKDLSSSLWRKMYGERADHYRNINVRSCRLNGLS